MGVAEGKIRLQIQQETRRQRGAAAQALPLAGGARTFGGGVLLVRAAVHLTHDIIVRFTATSLMDNYDVILYSCLRQNYKGNDKGMVMYFYFDHGG